MAKTLHLLIATSLCLAPLTFTTGAQAEGATLASASQEQKKAAAAEYREGMKAFEAQQFDDALAAFKKSYDTVSSPNSLLMVGRTLIALGRLGEAYDTLRTTARTAEEASASDAKYSKTHDAAQKELKELQGRVGFVNVELSGMGEGDRVTVAGGERTPDELAQPIAVTPGSVKVAVISANGEETERSVEVTEGATLTVQLSPRKAGSTATESTGAGAKATRDTGKAGDKTLAYVAGGIGIAGMVTFGVFGILNNGKFGDLQERCPNRICPADLKDDADAGQTYQTIANVGLVVGVIGLGTGATLYFLSERGGSKERTAQDTTRTAPRVSVGWRSVVVSGGF